jgi:hypothetical protein
MISTYDPLMQTIYIDFGTASNSVGSKNPLAYSPFGNCLECHGENVVSEGRQRCLPCPLGTGPANAQRTHCKPCQGDMVSKFGVCESCPTGKIGDGDGISCSDCPTNAEPSDMPMACRCSAGYYNSSFGLVRCMPDAMPTPQDGLVCQPCGACLDCDTSVGTFARALVRPGHKLGVAATDKYQGVERGGLHVDKIFHKCSHDMCSGESGQNALSRDTVQFGLTVNSVNMELMDLTSEARAAFGSATTNALALVLDVSPEDIAIDNVAHGSVTLRRWLQDLLDAAVTVTVTVNSDVTAALIDQIHEIRNRNATTIKLGETSTVDTSTFTQPVVMSHYDSVGIQCREGHDSTSPLCHVCLDGA